MTNLAREDAIGRLQEQLDEISRLKKQGYHSSRLIPWQRDTKIAIAQTVGESSSQAREFRDIKFAPAPKQGSYKFQEFQYRQAYIGGLNTAAELLSELIADLRGSPTEHAPKLSNAEAGRMLQPANMARVYVIAHGSDHGHGEIVTGLLRNLGLEPVVLEAQPYGGSTTIEKLEQHTGIDFAVALLSPVDAGDVSNNELQSRGIRREIFELGYLVGKVGPGRVIALVDVEFEIPLGFSGVVFIPLDAGGDWRTELAKEMNGAGIPLAALRSQ